MPSGERPKCPGVDEFRQNRSAMQTAFLDTKEGAHGKLRSCKAGDFLMPWSRSARIGVVLHADRRRKERRRLSPPEIRKFQDSAVELTYEGLMRVSMGQKLEDEKELLAITFPPPPAVSEQLAAHETPPPPAEVGEDLGADTGVLQASSHICSASPVVQSQFSTVEDPNCQDLETETIVPIRAVILVAWEVASLELDLPFGFASLGRFLVRAEKHLESYFSLLGL